ncbi:MAG: HAD family hydrolase [Trueperaceae bacterium]
MTGPVVGHGTGRDGAPLAALVFDLDGTLVDSLADIVGSFRDAVAEGGVPAPSEAEVAALIGAPLEAMAGRFTSDPATVRAVCDAYRRIYPTRFARSTRPFPGVREVLDALRGRGWALTVATTKRTDMARRLTDALDLTRQLDHVQGTDDGVPHKPAPDVVLRAAAAVGAEARWMIGDTVTDLQAGRAAGLRTYAVTWGTHDAQRLANERPNVLADDLDGLLEAVGRPD